MAHWEKMVSNLWGESPFSVFLKDDGLFTPQGKRKHADRRPPGCVWFGCGVWPGRAQNSAAATWLSSPILTGNGFPVKYCRGLPVCEFSEYRKSLFDFPYSLDCTTCIGVKAARRKVRLLKSSEVGPKKPLLYLKWRVACCYVLYGMGKVSQQHFWVN